MKSTKKSIGAIALMMAASSFASGQVVINEVYENPSGERVIKRCIP